MTKKLPSKEELLALGCTGVTEDSREVAAGYLFVALQGADENGVDYVMDAVERGAKFILSLEKLPPDLKLPDGVHSFVHNEPRRSLALLAKHFCGQVPQHLFGVTGTSGKTSCCIFVAQLLRTLRMRAIYAGTLGFDIGRYRSMQLLQGTILHPSNLEPERVSNLTSERATVLYAKLHEAYKKGIGYGVIEASSVGLAQSRLDGLSFEVGAITTFGDDHLANHGSLEAYKQAKLLLFRRNLAKFGVIVVGRGLEDWLRADGDDFNMVTMDGDTPDFGYKLVSKGQLFNEMEVTLPYKVTGDEKARKKLTSMLTWRRMPSLQYDNLIVAMAMLSVSGIDPALVMASSQQAIGVKGRFEDVAYSQDGKRIVVDYAHNAHSLEYVLGDLRKDIEGDAKLHVVFGAGGNRDAGRRSGMGSVAKNLADKIIVTDDNPRNENPQAIRDEIMAHAGVNAREVSSREVAISDAVEGMSAGDILLIAGKGDEDITVGEKKIPFDDRSYALAAFNRHHPLEEKPFYEPCLFLGGAFEKLYGKPFLKVDSCVPAITGVSVDTRTLREGDAFFAINGERHDGHRHIFDALQKGASAIIATDLEQVTVPCAASVFKVDDSLKALWDLAGFARENKIKKVVGITGSVGKTSSRQAIDWVVSRVYRSYASRGNLNNHFGLPLSLVRTPYHTEVGIYEVGIDCAEEMPPISNLLVPDVAVFTSFAPTHTLKLGSIEGVIKAKLQLLEHMKEGADVLLPSEAFDYPQFFEVLQQYIEPYKDKFRFRFLGYTEKATDKIIKAEQNGKNLDVEVKLMNGRHINFTMKTIGAHWALTGLIALVVGDLLALPLEASTRALSLFVADKGRGRFVKTDQVSIIDHSYNASPASMKAAIDSLVSIDIPKGSNRFAVFGDMEDLGDSSHAYHVRALEYANQTNIDGCFLVGERFSKALESCSEISRQRFLDHKGGHQSLANVLRSFLSQGDILMVKGSRKCYLDTLISMLT